MALLYPNRIDTNSYLEVELNGRQEINYSIKSGLIELLIGSTGTSKEEVWSNIADIAQVCANRLASKNGANRGGNSWTQKEYPGTDVKIRVDMDAYHRWCPEENIHKPYYSARVKLANVGTWQSFTSKQVEEYIDKLILGET